MVMCSLDNSCATPSSSTQFDHKFRLRRNFFTMELERQAIASELRHTNDHVEALIAWYVLCVRYEHSDQLTRCAFRYMLDTVMSLGAKEQYPLLAKIYQTYELEIEMLLHNNFYECAAGNTTTCEGGSPPRKIKKPTAPVRRSCMTVAEEEPLMFSVAP